MARAMEVEKKRVYRASVHNAKNRIEKMKASTKHSKDVKERHIEATEKRIVQLEEKIDEINLTIALGNSISMFTGYNVKDSSYSRLAGMKLARGLFYKYGIDKGISPSNLRLYTGAKDSAIPNEYRKYINSSDENKEIYNRFKEQFELIREG